MKKTRSWVEIDKKNLIHNFSVLKKNLNKKTLVALVVKSNAYGHGMKEVASILKDRADFFAVDDILEALELIDIGIKKPIIVFGYTLPMYYATAMKKNISITISSINQLKNLSLLSKHFNKKIKIHIKIDTGLRRQGIYPIELSQALKLIRNSKIKLEGIYSHFAAAENPKNAHHVAFSEMQISIFNSTLEETAKEGFKPIAHIAGSAASMIIKNSEFGMIREGISLYGLWPSSESKKAAEVRVKLKPVLTWKSIITEIKSVNAGDYVGYDLTEKLNKNSKLAIVPIGYWHGYRRSFSSQAFVLVKGKRAKVVGRVSMDMIVIDVTGISGVFEGQEVVILGRQGKVEVNAEELAQIAGTINYEIVTSINPLIPRLIK